MNTQNQASTKRSSKPRAKANPQPQVTPAPKVEVKVEPKPEAKVEAARVETPPPIPKSEPTPAPTPEPKGIDAKALAQALREALPAQPKYNSKVAVNLAWVLLGLGGLGVILLFSPIPLWELANIALLIFLPILGAMFCIGLVSFGTVQMIWNMGLREEVEARYQEMKAQVA